MKKIVVLGASPNPERFSHQAIRCLLKRHYDVVAIGLRPGYIGELPIVTGKPDEKPVDTLLLYIGPRHQEDYYGYIIEQAPRRVIFNPGTENPVLISLCRDNGIEVVLDCSLMMMSAGTF